MSKPYDLAIVGAGICGLAHALAAARRGKRVVVIDKDAQANGASVRNFGFVTVTGQQRGDCWRRAMRSREVWSEVAAKADIAIEHQGLLVAVRRPAAAAVLEAFAQTEMAEGCQLLSPAEARQRLPALRDDGLVRALWSPHEVRVESRTAIPKLAKWLQDVHGVTFLRSTLVSEVALPRVVTSGGIIEAGAAVVCANDDFLTLYPGRIACYGLRKCKLHMLRVAPQQKLQLGMAVMSDLGLVRYLGYAELAEAAILRRQLEAEQRSALDNGVHLIAVQSADGTLVVGDSHHTAATPDPFAPEAVDEIIMAEFDAVLEAPGRRIVERWTGIYPTAPDRLMLVDKPADGVRVVIITSGTGASTSFAIGEQVIGELFD